MLELGTCCCCWFGVCTKFSDSKGGGGRAAGIGTEGTLGKLLLLLFEPRDELVTADEGSPGEEPPPPPAAVADSSTPPKVRPIGRIVLDAPPPPSSAAESDTTPTGDVVGVPSPIAPTERTLLLLCTLLAL